MRRSAGEETVTIPIGTVTLTGNLSVPCGAPGLVLFAHGSGSSRHEAVSGIPIGHFGASTGAAAALIAAAELPELIGAVVSRGGRPDLARESLGRVRAPTLLIVGGDDTVVLEMNREALRSIRAPKELAVVAGATHLFEEPGTLEEVARLAASWLTQHLGPQDVAGVAAP